MYKYSRTAVAMSPHGQLFGVSARCELRIVNRGGAVLHRIPHPAWGPFTGSNCFFDFKDRLWYVRPGDKPGFNDRLTIIEPYAGTIIAEQKIENNIGHFDLFLCPDQESALIEVSCGQDGSDLYLARLTESGLAIEEYPFSDRTFFGGFSPDGREFATGAHACDAIKVHSCPSGRVIASVESDTIFGGENLGGERPDYVGYIVIFLDRDRLLAQTGFGRLILLDRRGMRLLGTVWPPGYTIRGYDRSGRETDDPVRIMSYEGNLTSVHPAGKGKVLTVYSDGVIRLLDVLLLLSTPTGPE